MFLDGQRVVGAALDGRIVDDEHALGAVDRPDAGDDAAGRHFVAVHAGRRQRREFEERAAGIEQPVDALPGQQLAPLQMFLAGSRAAPFQYLAGASPQLGHEFAHLLRVTEKLLGTPVHFRLDLVHRGPAVFLTLTFALTGIDVKRITIRVPTGWSSPARVG